MATPLHTTLEQELNALLRGVSYECLACGEFVLRAVAPCRARSAARTCATWAARPEQGYNSTCRPGDRGRTATGRTLEKVRTPKGRTLGKPQAAKADGKWHRKETASGARLSGDGGKGETVG